MSLEIQKFAVLSNAHLSSAARAWLDNMAEKNADAHNAGGVHTGAPIGSLGTTLFGWFTHVPEDVHDLKKHGIPDALWIVFYRLRKMEVAYALFDADGPEVDFLPRFDFDTDEREAEAEAFPEPDGPRPGVAPDDGGNLADELIEPDYFTQFVPAPNDRIVIRGYKVISEIPAEWMADLIHNAMTVASLLEDAIDTHIYAEDDPRPADEPYAAAIHALREAYRPFAEAKIPINREGGYYAQDGTLMNADGTRSIFDDVDR